jgi:integrase/recombinase XerD
MRWSGPSIRDALTLKKSRLIHDKASDRQRVITRRTKTGTHVSVVLPPDVAAELLSVVNKGEYIFWDGSKTS